jgi:transcriptional regulator with XRE-family HTH domain
VDSLRAGAIVRAERRRRGLRQADVAALAGAAQQTVSMLERGEGGDLTLRMIKRIGAALQITVGLALRTRGPEPDRLLDARHARLVAAVVARLGPEWSVLPEHSFNDFGDRGSVDVLAWHAATKALLLIEVKSELDSLESVLRSMDVRVRVVPCLVAAERGWRHRFLGSVLVLPDESTARRAVAALRPVMDAALPRRTIEVRQWVRRPDGPLRGIWFLADTPVRRAIRNPGSPGRVRRHAAGERHAQDGLGCTPGGPDGSASGAQARIPRPPGVFDGDGARTASPTPTSSN